jgi:hypothetical protein
MDKEKNAANGPMFVDEEISKFTCYAKTGILYGFWMRISFKSPKAASWNRSPRGESVSVWFTGNYDICNATGIQEGDHVMLDIEVIAGSSSVPASQYFIYKRDSSKIAHYEATGTTFAAAVTYEGVVSR